MMYAFAFFFFFFFPLRNVELCLLCVSVTAMLVMKDHVYLFISQELSVELFLNPYQQKRSVKI